MDRFGPGYGRRALRVSWWHRSCVARGKGTSDVAKKSKTLGRVVLSSAFNRQWATHAGYGITMVLLAGCLVYRLWFFCHQQPQALKPRGGLERVTPTESAEGRRNKAT